VVLVVDGQSGLHPSDEEVLTWLRQHHPSKPVLLAVNKCESQTKGATQVRGGG
jgi:GTP-binding protein